VLHTRFFRTFFAFFLLTWVPHTRAQSSAGGDQQKEERRQIADWLDVGFSERLRYETLDHRFRLGEVGSDGQLAQRTQLRIGIKNVADPLRFEFEWEDSRVHFTDEDSMVNSTIVDKHDIVQLHFSLVLNHGAGGPPSTLSVGRQAFDLGNRRLFTRNRFRNVSSRWDGVRWSVGSPGRRQLDTFFFMPVRLRMEEWDRRLKGTYFWGAYFSAPWKFAIGTEFYYFGLRDDPESASSARRRFSTVGGRFFRTPQPRKFGFEVESAWQFGERAELDHFAHMQHLQLSYAVDAPWQPILSGLYDYASGDKDPYDDDSGDFDTLFGDRRFEFGPTGIYNWMYRSNVSSPALYLVLNPIRRFEVLPSIRWLWLAQARAAWAGQGLRDPSGHSGTYVGSSMEWRLRYNIASYFRPEICYVHFFKGPFPAHVPGSPTAKDSDYFYVELELRIDDLFK
jgi:hypothetical protein